MLNLFINKGPKKVLRITILNSKNSLFTLFVLNIIDPAHRHSIAMCNINVTK